MQGTLNEIDIRSILQLIELGQRTGELFVEAYVPPQGVSTNEPQDSWQTNPIWFVFFVNGQIIYAADNTNSSLLRLRDYLRRYKVEDSLNKFQNSSIAATNTPEYGYLWLLLENNILTTAQGRNILQNMIEETLFDILSLHQGSFIFEMGSALAPQLMTVEFGPLVPKIMKQVQKWKQFYPHIQFPQQCPLINDPSQLKNALQDNAYQGLERWADGKTSLRQLSRYLNRDLFTVAKAIYPYVQKGWVQLINHPSAPSQQLVPQWQLKERETNLHVACIDDDLTIGKTVELILDQQGYSVMIITDPIQALSQIFQKQPDLILCDIAMPEIDGYELCAMLRSSTRFRQTPIIMLTGKDGFIDRVRARMVGATDYLTKPFGAGELLMLLEKYAYSGISLKVAKNDTAS
jgi:twitching motility two-component system response regulator PilG